MRSINYRMKKAALAGTVLSALGMAVLSSNAHASVTDDLIGLLEAKGLVSSAEAEALKAKNAQEQKQREASIRQQILKEQGPAKGQGGVSQEAIRKAVKAETQKQIDEAVNEKLSVYVETALKEQPFVRALDNGGVGFQAGDIKFQVSGNINTFSTFENFGNDDFGVNVAGGLVVPTQNDTFSVRNGLLPNALVFDISTVQRDFDIGVKVGLFPGTNNLNTASGSALNANSGGTSFALGTPGIDARLSSLTIGREDIGTFKFGRDFGIFGRNAIVNDFTLFGVGSTGGNAAPANTSLGRIGIGYIYTDFIPQISYKSPSFNGFTFEGGIFQAFDALDAAGGLSGTATGSPFPQFQGQVEYNGKFGAVDTTLWAGFATIAYEGEPGEALGLD